MTLPTGYFDDLYARHTDPWGFTDRWYEQRKRALCLASLPERSYPTAYEPGCSIGVLTAALAERCRSLLASDVSAAALRVAAGRLNDQPHVRLAEHAIPQDWPDGEFDLVVLSEVLYYLGDADLDRAQSLAVAAVAAGGTLLSVHWRHPVADYPQTGDRVQQVVHDATEPQLVRLVHHVEDDFCLSVHVRPRPGQSRSQLSVAARDGLC